MPFLSIFFMDPIPDLFFVKGQFESSPFIYRGSDPHIGSPDRAVFVGEQDTEPAVLRALLIYVQQENINDPANNVTTDLVLLGRNIPHMTYAGLVAARAYIAS